MNSRCLLVTIATLLVSCSAAQPQENAQPKTQTLVTSIPISVATSTLSQAPTEKPTAVPTKSSPEPELNVLALSNVIEIGAPAVFAFSPSGDQVAVSSDDPIGVEMRDTTSGETVWTFSVPAEDLSSSPNWVHALAFSASGDYLAIGGNTRSIYLVDAKTGALLRRREPYDRVSQLAFSTDEETIFSGSRDENAHIMSWDLTTQDTTGLPFPGQAFAMFPGDRRLAVTYDGFGSGLRIVDLDTGSESALLSESTYVASVKVSPDGRFIAALTDDAVWLWRQNGDAFGEIALPWSRYQEFSAPYSQVAFSSAGALGIVSANRGVFVWDLAAQELIGVAYTDIGQIGFTPAGDQLVVSGEALTFWSVRDSQSPSTP